MPTKVFWLERSNRVKVWMRRYRSVCPKGDGHQTCEASLVVHENAPSKAWGTWKLSKHRGQRSHWFWDVKRSKIPLRDRRWGRMRCERCGVAFDRMCAKQVWAEHLYVGAPNDVLYTIRDAPPGAMWNADWLTDYEWATGPDGIALMVRLPNRWDWHVDGPASNCGNSDWAPVPGEPNARRWRGRTHYCWVRHGDPRTGNIYVDKNGQTCTAGAGSIAAGSYHGFLHNGYLTDG